MPSHLRVTENADSPCRQMSVRRKDMGQLRKPTWRFRLRPQKKESPWLCLSPSSQKAQLVCKDRNNARQPHPWVLLESLSDNLGGLVKICSRIVFGNVPTLPTTN